MALATLFAHSIIFLWFTRCTLSIADDWCLVATWIAAGVEREECWLSRKVSRGWVPIPLAQPRLPTRLPEVYYRARSGLENSRVGPTAPGHFGECLGILMQSLMRESYFISRALALTLTC